MEHDVQGKTDRAGDLTLDTDPELEDIELSSEQLTDCDAGLDPTLKAHSDVALNSGPKTGSNPRMGLDVKLDSDLEASSGIQSDPGLETNPDLQLDSTYFMAFEMAHKALKKGLSRASALNTAQYHALIKIFVSGDGGITQTDLGKILYLKANVVSQAVNVLEKAGLVTRTRDTEDKRIRIVRITEAGVKHITEANASIVEQLYTIFPTADDFFRSILEASIAAGAYIDPPVEGANITLFPASRALVSLELIHRLVATTLRRLANVSLNEYRVLQRLSESSTPLRNVDLTSQLRMSPATVTRATDRLVKQLWATRLASPVDRKAVFVVLTDTGRRKHEHIARAIDILARNNLWKNLTQEQRQTIAQVGHVVIARLQDNDEAKRKEALSLLLPAD